ncbi:MAG TPA: hypothetical protein VN936_07245, partial [Candidatus Acidoferrum sp.]|nr:hypothetical protein [Candidatus Acidoferrum sp.]
DFMGGFGLIDLPRISAQETAYGMVATAARADGTKLFTHVIMPNIMLRDVAIQQDRTNLTIHAAWRVPIDDVTTLSVMIDRVSNFDESIRAGWANMTDPAEIAAQVMACEITLDEIDMEHPLLPVIQDTVTMGGQGLIADRSAEHLGSSDRAIALLRRIWKREMNAVRDGKPLTEWKRSGEGKLVTFEAGDAAS